MQTKQAGISASRLSGRLGGDKHSYGQAKNDEAMQTHLLYINPMEQKLRLGSDFLATPSQD